MLDDAQLHYSKKTKNENCIKKRITVFSRKIKEKLTQRIFSPFSLLKVAINQKTYFKKD